jgi:transcriptional regulator with XRE-family HTH domain
MTEHIMEIANRLKELREIENISVERMSELTGVPVKKIQEYENGTVDIPIGYLTEAAIHYHVEITEIITGEKPRLHMYTICRAGRGVSVERMKEYEFQALASNFVRRKCNPYLVIVNPDEDMPPYVNAHEGQEFDYILEGKMKMVIEEKEVILNEGDCIYLDSTFRHAIKGIGKQAKFLAVVLP